MVADDLFVELLCEVRFVQGKRGFSFVKPQPDLKEVQAELLVQLVKQLDSLVADEVFKIPKTAYQAKFGLSEVIVVVLLRLDPRGVFSCLL